MKKIIIILLMLNGLTVQAQNYLWTWGTMVDNMTYSPLYPTGWTYQYGFPVPIEQAPQGSWISITNNEQGSVGSTSGAIRNDGTLWMWNRPSSKSPVPYQKGTDSDWEYITAGFQHFTAIKEDGTIWSWSVATANHNYVGQLGRDNSIVAYTEPGQIGTETNWVDVVSSNDYSIALKSDGSIWGWGEVSNGVELLVPTQLGTDTDWASISSSTAIKANGTLWKRTSQTFAQVGTDNNWEAIAAFQNTHYLAIKTDGTLWAFGNNVNGQLGTGSTSNQTNPIQIGTDTDWEFISAGNTFSLALKTNGTLWGWGKNDTEQLGLGNNYQSDANQLLPIQIGTDNDWLKIDAGGFHVTAVKATGYDQVSYEAEFGGNVGLDGLSSKSEILIYPNPTNDFVTISGLSEGDIIKVLDISGKEVYNLISNNKNNTISTQNFTEGMYFLHIEKNENIIIEKVVIKK